MPPHARNRLLVIIVIVLFLAVLLGTSLKSLNDTRTDSTGGAMSPGMRMP
jgi:cytochrome c-type biogenesis protein CcmE